MVTKPADIADDVARDFASELASGYVYKHTEAYFKPYFEQIRKEHGDDSILGDALESALSTLKFQIINSTMAVIEQYAIEKLIKVAGILFLYIKGNSIAKKAKNVGRGIMGFAGKWGGAPLKMFKGAMGAIIGTQEERLAMAKMANDNANSLTRLIAQERLVQSTNRATKVNHFNQNLSEANKIKHANDSKDMDMFMYKTKTGSWNKDDSQLFKRTTKAKTYNTKVMKELNKFKEFAKDADGNIINSVQAHVDYISALAFEKVS